MIFIYVIIFLLLAFLGGLAYLFYSFFSFFGQQKLGLLIGCIPILLLFYSLYDFLPKNYDEDDFYNTLEGLNDTYLPILKPYIIYESSSENRYINFEGWQIGQVNHVTGLCVNDSLIYIKSNNHQQMMEKQKYFLIEYFYGNELGFGTEIELFHYCDSAGYQRPIWKSYDELWSQVESDGYPWNIKLDSLHKCRVQRPSINLKK